MKLLLPTMAAMLLCNCIACHTPESANLEMLSAKETADQEMKLKTIAPGVYDAGETYADTSIVLPSKTQQTKPHSETETNEDWDKKIIKTGHLTMEVKKYATFDELVHTTVKKSGGYMAQEQQNHSEYKIENAVIIKVPVEQFENAMMLLSSPEQKLVEKKITSEDVTGVLVDTKARVEAKKKVRDRYLDFLKQAKNMEEVLKVQAEINGIQETIEAGSGRINYLGHAAAYSTIHLNYYQVLTTPSAEDAHPSYGIRILASFKSGLQWLAEFCIVLVTLWPLWMGIALAWFFVKRIRLSPVKRKQ